MHLKCKPGDIVKGTYTGILYTVIGSIECGNATVFSEYCYTCNRRACKCVISSISDNYWRTLPGRVFELFEIVTICPRNIVLIDTLEDTEKGPETEIVP